MSGEKSGVRMPTRSQKRKLPGYKNWTHWKNSKNAVVGEDYPITILKALTYVQGKLKNNTLGQKRSGPVVSGIGNVFKIGMQADSVRILHAASATETRYVLARHDGWAHTSIAS